jgi:hypothetical protein
MKNIIRLICSLPLLLAVLFGSQTFAQDPSDGDTINPGTKAQCKPGECLPGDGWYRMTGADGRPLSKRVGCCKNGFVRTYLIAVYTKLGDTTARCYSLIADDGTGSNPKPCIESIDPDDVITSNQSGGCLCDSQGV